MTPEEKAALNEQASLHHKTMSEYIRSVAKCPPDVTRDEFESSIVRMIYEINKIGVNINQIAKKYNEHNYVEPSEELLCKLDEVYGMMKHTMEKKIHSTPKDVKGAEVEKTITAGMIQSAVNHEMKREAEERKAWFIENFDKLALLDIYASEWTSETRRKVIRELLQAGAEEGVIKSIIRPEIEEGQVLQKKGMWLEMQQCSCP